jgi:hypothetical protein
MVYVDHCGLMTFAEDIGLGRRLTTALHACDGTLAISWLNFCEYATVSDLTQRHAVERLLDDILPALFCIDVDPSVMDRERGGRPFPHADESLSRLFLNHREATVRPLTAARLFEPLNCELLIRGKGRLAAKVQPKLEALRTEYARNPAFRNDVANADATPDTLAPSRTKAIFRTLAATFLPDLRRPITENDVLDVLHAVVPTAYCDAVLLDGGMWDRVERTRRKLSGVGVEMAHAFPMRRDGVEDFLRYLEGV